MAPRGPAQSQDSGDVTLKQASLQKEIKNHEAEDLDQIPFDFQNEALLTLNSENLQESPPSLHWALKESRRQGERPLRFSEKTNSLRYYSQRCSTFSTQWNGPPKSDMARAGFYFLSKDKACCAFCEVEIRQWRPDHCPWLQHKNFSPHCRHLKSSMDAGTKPSQVDGGNLTLWKLYQLCEKPQILRTTRMVQNKHERNVIKPVFGPVCVICDRRSARVVFLPCSHIVTCSTCADTMDDCIICRTPVLATCVRIRLPLPKS